MKHIGHTARVGSHQRFDGDNREITLEVSKEVGLDLLMEFSHRNFPDGSPLADLHTVLKLMMKENG